MSGDVDGPGGEDDMSESGILVDLKGCYSGTVDRNLPLTLRYFTSSQGLLCGQFMSLYLNFLIAIWRREGIDNCVILVFGLLFTCRLVGLRGWRTVGSGDKLGVDTSGPSSRYGHVGDAILSFIKCVVSS